MMRIGVLGVALAMLTGPAAFAAQPAESWEAYRPKTPEDEAADKITAAENLKYVEISHAVDARNAAAKKAYEDQLAAHEAALAKLKADAEAARAAYAKATAEWEAQVAACKARDLKKCPTAAAKTP